MIASGRPPAQWTRVARSIAEGFEVQAVIAMVKVGVVHHGKSFLLHRDACGRSLVHLASAGHADAYYDLVEYLVVESRLWVGAERCGGPFTRHDLRSLLLGKDGGVWTEDAAPGEFGVRPWGVGGGVGGKKRAVIVGESEDESDEMSSLAAGTSASEEVAALPTLLAGAGSTNKDHQHDSSGRGGEGSSSSSGNKGKTSTSKNGTSEGGVQQSSDGNSKGGQQESVEAEEEDSEDAEDPGSPLRDSMMLGSFALGLLRSGDADAEMAEQQRQQELAEQQAKIKMRTRRYIERSRKEELEAAASSLAELQKGKPGSFDLSRLVSKEEGEVEEKKKGGGNNKSLTEVPSKEDKTLAEVQSLARAGDFGERSFAARLMRRHSGKADVVARRGGGLVLQFWKEVVR